MYYPKNYQSKLTLTQTQEAIKIIRDKFQKELGRQLNLKRVSAPLFVERNSGLNDDLNGTEDAVSFTMKDMNNEQIEVIHSLAKWKRMALKNYGFLPHTGIYTNMNAIRKDETLDNLHSAYVDQWDWEKVIYKDERTVEMLKETVKAIVKVIKHIEHEVWYVYPEAVYTLPEDVTFITSQELLNLYPNLSPKERENEIAKKHGCVFLMKIGDYLSNFEKHDGRAPDYDDWTLNGDLLYWFDTLNCAMEISSMGIRVDENSIVSQCQKAGDIERLKLPYHQAVINSQLPYTIGGGIGQSRLCMLLLQKVHIGEVQSSIWPKEMLEQCKNANIQLL